MVIPLHHGLQNHHILIVRLLLSTQLARASAYSCSQPDQELLGSSFGPDYWTCVESTSTNNQLQICVLNMHPDMQSISSSCSNCISNVFLLGGSDCIIDCRTQSNSPACIACRNSVANRWYSQCVPKVSIVTPTRTVILLILFVIGILS